MPLVSEWLGINSAEAFELLRYPQIVNCTATRSVFVHSNTGWRVKVTRPPIKCPYGIHLLDGTYRECQGEKATDNELFVAGGEGECDRIYTVRLNHQLTQAALCETFWGIPGEGTSMLEAGAPSDIALGLRINGIDLLEVCDTLKEGEYAEYTHVVLENGFVADKNSHTWPPRLIHLWLATADDMQRQFVTTVECVNYGGVVGGSESFAPSRARFMFVVCREFMAALRRAIYLHGPLLFTGHEGSQLQSTDTVTVSRKSGVVHFVCSRTSAVSLHGVCSSSRLVVECGATRPHEVVKAEHDRKLARV